MTIVIYPLIPFVPVSDAIIRGLARMSKMSGVSNQGI